MMNQPSNLLRKLTQRLFQEEAQQAEFIEALTQPQPFHPCILWRDERPVPFPFEVVPALDWQPTCVDRLALGQKPGRHSLHQAGAFYCLDFSSVFAASPLLTLPVKAPIVLDMCASPGGKSIFAWATLQPQLLLSNEVIGKRLGQLVGNLKRCRIHPTIVTHLDPQVFADTAVAIADVVLVDAPCTGQSLLAKGEKAPGCFHPVSINKNANRQKRVLANSAQTVAPGGYLLYMTCAYSPEENEQVGEWLLSKFPQFQPLPVPHLRDYQSHLTDLPAYRIWPQSRLGAGAFTMLFQNQSIGERQPLSQEFLTQRGVNCLQPTETEVE